MNYLTPQRRRALAARYVAGTLRGRARRRFDALLPAHPSLAAEVAVLERTLHPLDAAQGAEAPPARVWRGVEERLGWRDKTATLLGRWGFAAGGFACALMLMLLASPLLAPEVVPTPLVVLENAGGTPMLVVSHSAQTGKLYAGRLRRDAATPGGRVLELWALPKSGAPRSLGVIGDADQPLAGREAELAGATGLAVSVEPEGGAPHGQPTGPIVYTGALDHI
ncbi:anti-sigma-K factor RskA [Crenobacter luteus]|uniref:anti-sigma factor n=1 Tax=Crenobacter luteus TaxID=1452487 RepID=UPI00104318F9|nr:anti-sigma factor [Crenobacter luteus]TCP12122.1 anti-sigma-K factor RskA [Crenobacter luteus]